MAITRQKKEEVVHEIAEAFDEAQVAVFTDFKGMDVTALTELRVKLRESGGTYKVAKKRLIARVLKERGIAIDPVAMEGDIAIAFGMKDPVATSKAVYQAQKDTDILKIISGLMGENILTAQDVVQLATLPSREELLAKAVGSINAPVSGFVRVLNGNVQGLVFALKAIGEQKA